MLLCTERLVSVQIRPSNEAYITRWFYKESWWYTYQHTCTRSLTVYISTLIDTSKRVAKCKYRVRMRYRILYIRTNVVGVPAYFHSVPDTSDAQIFICAHF